MPSPIYKLFFLNGCFEDDDGGELCCHHSTILTVQA